MDRRAFFDRKIIYKKQKIYAYICMYYEDILPFSKQTKNNKEKSSFLF